MTVALEAPVEEAQAAPRGPWRAALRRLLRKRIAVACLSVILLFYAAGILAPLLAPYGNDEQNLDVALQGPSRQHLLGTDRLGRDMLSRLIWASRTTVIVTVATLVTGGIVLGVGLGLLAGYRGGMVDTVIGRVGDVFYSLPGLVILILLTATLRPKVEDLARHLENLTGIGGIRSSGAPDYLLVFGALSLFGWVGGARVIRSQVLALRESEYVMAARTMGASTFRIIFRHILPNVSNIIIVGVSASLGAIAGSEVALTWFGVGVQPPTPSFGVMIFEGSGLRVINAHPYLLLEPGMTVAALIFAFNLLGDALTDILTPRAR